MVIVAVLATGFGCRKATQNNGARAPLADETKPPKLENALLEVKLGSTAKALEQRFATLYRHQLAMGEVLYEACDRKNLLVFTFVAEPWSPEFVTSILVRQEHDVGVCRDATGGLPDLGFAAVTARVFELAILPLLSQQSTASPTRSSNCPTATGSCATAAAARGTNRRFRTSCSCSGYTMAKCSASPSPVTFRVRRLHS
jgi:hypothetical protein